MAMAIQHERPATISRICTVRGDMPPGFKPGRVPKAFGRSAVSARRRSRNASGSMMTIQATAIHRSASRQPTVSIAYDRIGGQMVPDR